MEYALECHQNKIKLGKNGVRLKTISAIVTNYGIMTKLFGIFEIFETQSGH